MKKFILVWQIDWTKVPFVLQGSICGLLIAQVKHDIEKRVIKQWDSYVGETIGYVVGEGIPVEVGPIVEKYLPLVSFEFHPIGSESVN